METENGNETPSPAEKKKRKKPVKLNPRSLAWLRAQGMIAEVVEKKIPYKFITQDLFGFADILAIDTRGPVPGATFVQVTSGSNAAARVAKLTRPPAPESGEPDVSKNVRACLEAGNRVVVHAWRKVAVYKKGRRAREGRRVGASADPDHGRPLPRRPFARRRRPGRAGPRRPRPAAADRCARRVRVKSSSHRSRASADLAAAATARRGSPPRRASVFEKPLPFLAPVL
jgi:hypothetical protein